MPIQKEKKIITSKNKAKLLGLPHIKNPEEATYWLAAIVSSSDDAIVSKNLKSIITSWNEAAEKLFGYTAIEAIGKKITIIIPLNLRKEEKEIIKKLKKGIRIEHFETTRMRKDGSKLMVSLSISPIKDDKGKIIGAAKIARDITSQKKAEQMMRENEERLRLALEAGKIGAWEWDIPKNVIIWSDRVYGFYGADPNTFKVNFENFSKHIHPEDKKMTEEAIKNAVSGKKPYNITYRIITMQGEVCWIYSRAIVFRDAKGRPLKMLGATIDTSEQKKIEQNKNDFVSIATHELKTPVTSLKAYAEVLQRKFQRAGDEYSATQLGKMNAQLDKLTSLISDLLDATKIDAGKLHMHEDTFDFDELVREIVEELQRTTERHTLILKGNAKRTITADRERTGQVLTNLISNAIKYSPHSGEIFIIPSGEVKNVQVCIQDFGVGIPKSKQGKLFERFYRISGPDENTFPGLGLGLYISNEIVKRQGGRLWVESALGKGSTFCFSIPTKIKVSDKKKSLTRKEIEHL